MRADPDGHLLDAIARYALGPVVDGTATFESKRALGSLPRDLDCPGRFSFGGGAARVRRFAGR